jgi:hypothetical protein
MQAAGIFAASPVPSDHLQATNIAVPVSLTDHQAIHQPAIKRQRVADGTLYHGLVIDHARNVFASVEDQRQSSQYLFSTQLSENLVHIQRNVAAEIVQLLNPRFDEMRDQLNQMRADSNKREAMGNNSSIDNDGDEIQWFETPAVLMNGVMVPHPVPQQAPQTKGEFMSSPQATIDALLGYYHLNQGGNFTVFSKRKRLAKYLWFPRILWR